MYPLTPEETVALYVAVLSHETKCRFALEDVEKELAKRPDSAYLQAGLNICKSEYEKAKDALAIAYRILHTSPK